MKKGLNERFLNKANTGTEFVFFTLIILVLFIIQISGLYHSFLGYIDLTLKPFVLNFRDISRETIHVYKFILNANLIIKENLDLKQKLLNYESVIKENHELKKFIETELKFNNLNSIGFNYKLIPIGRISGVKNLYSSNPIFKVYNIYNEYIPKKGEIVVLGNCVFLGFVSDITGNTITVKPFYSDAILKEITIPVYNLRDNSIKGLVAPLQRGEVFIKNISAHKEVREGDIWVTSNEAFEVPPGLIVGKTNYVFQNKDTGFNEVNIRLFFEPTDLNFVYVIPE